VTASGLAGSTALSVGGTVLGSLDVKAKNQRSFSSVFTGVKPNACRASDVETL